MAKQLNVGLVFTADTHAAQAQLRQLQQQLDSIVQGNVISKELPLTKSIQQGMQAAAQLKAQLTEATNVNTGKLDLTKFSTSLRRSGMEISDYASKLMALGPTGTQAFMSMAKAISNADAPLLSVNAKAQALLTTLKNTARWQISSTMLHAVIGTIQHAYGYAQDLNKSLNNIRIVTGKSAEEMAIFADQANKAAKALSTTTLDYTDAALIYYQQGIRDQEEIAGRVETTIKLANVSRQSAEEVSQQMTAIWNNFYNGSKSLEYYADVITALGATTASSSEEIATGLEKFAAVANTVGLSYEYATAALATITAQTRQSADTVGTGLRTLFARLESVKLGETLDDGVELNKYSKALDDVGVQILDVNGSMKDMDTILDELGSRWNTLTREQQMALAQTVGGVRQYTNLIALMDNWDKMQQNVLTARGSEGTLQQQADIYAESWEAAGKRVKASAETIYNELLNDKFFITLTNGFAKILDITGQLIKNMGGFYGVLTVIAALILKMTSDTLVNKVHNLLLDLKNTSGSVKKAMGGLFNKNKELNEQTTEKSQAPTTVYDKAVIEARKMDNGTFVSNQQITMLEREQEFQQKLITNSKNLTEEKRQQLQIEMDGLRSQEQKILKEAEELDVAKNKTKELELQAKINIKARAGTSKEAGYTAKDVSDYIAAKQMEGQVAANTKTVSQALAGEGPIKNIEQLQASLSHLREQWIQVKEQSADEKDQIAIQEQINKIDQLATKLKDLPADTPLDEALKSASTEADNLNDALIDVAAQTERTVDEIASRGNGQLGEELEELGNSAYHTGYKMEELNLHSKNLDTRFKGIVDSIQGVSDKLRTFANNAVTTVQGMAQMASGTMMLINGLKNLSEVSKDGTVDMTKLLSSLMSVGFALPMLINGFKKVRDALSLSNPIMLAIIAALTALVLIWKEMKQNSPEAVLQRVSKATEEAKKAAEQAKTTYNELAQTFDKYETVIDKLIQLKTGTDAWNEANKEAIDIINELLSKYPELAALIERDENGNVTKESFQKIVEKAKQDSQQSTIAALGGQIAESKATDKVQRDNLYNTDTRYLLLADTIYNNNVSFIEGLEQFLTNYDEKSRESIRKNLLEGQQQIEDYNNNRRARENTEQQYAQQIADTYLDNEKYDYKQRQAAAEEYQKRYQEAYSSAKIAGTANISWASGRNDADVKAFMERYKNATGKDFDLAWNAVIGTDSNRSFKDVAGNEHSLESMINEIAAAEAAAYMEEIAKKTAKADTFEDTRKDVNTQGIKQQQADLQSIIGDGLKLGDIIKPEDIAKLQGAGVEISDYFTQMADGTYQLTSDAQRFNDTVKHITLDKLFNVVQNFNEAKNQLNGRDYILKTDESDYHSYTQEQQDDNNDLGRRRADYIKQFKGLDLSSVEGLSTLLTEIDNKAILTDEDLEKLAKGIDLVKEQSEQAEYQLFSNVTSLEELHSVTSRLSEYSEASYSQALINIASQYENCKTELDDYTKALASNDAEQVEVTRDALEAAIIVGEAAKEYGLNAEEIEIQAEQIQELNKDLKLTKQQAAQLAVANQRLNKGVKTLNENWATWGKTLKTGEHNTTDYAEAIVKTRSAVADLTNEIDENNISTAFLQDEKNLKLLDKAAEGDIAAIDQLNSNLAKSKLAATEWSDILQGLKDTNDDPFNPFATVDDLNTAISTITAGIDDIAAHRDMLKAGGDIAEALGGQQGLDNWISTLNQYAAATGMSVEEMNSLLSQIGVQAEVTTTTLRQKVRVPRYYTRTTVKDPGDPETGNGRLVATSTWQDGYDEAEGDIDVAQINTDGAGGTPKITYLPPSSSRAGGVSPSSTSSSKGGGGSSSKEKKTKKESDELDRYHYIRETIEDLERAYDEAGKAKDRLFGGKRVKAMGEEIAALDDLIDAQDRYLSEIKSYLYNTDIPNLTAGVKDYTGISVVLDEAGRIQNYDEIMRAAVAKFNADLSEDADEKYENFKALISQYEETANLYESELQKKTDQLREKQDKDFERLNYVIELKVKVNEADLKRIETTLTLLGESVYKAAERLNLLWNETDHTGDKLGNLNEAFGIAKYELDELNKKYANGEISLDAYASGLDDVRDKAYGALESLMDLDEQMRTYYSTTLSDATSELEFWNKQLEHGATVLEHYKKTAELSGRSKDYGLMNTILTGQEQVSKNQLDTLTAEYEMIHKQRLDIDAEMRAAQENYKNAMGTENEEYWKNQVEYLRDKWDSIVEADNEAYEARLEALNTYLENAEAVYQNKMDELYAQMEKDATNGIGFDFLNDSMERMNQRQDEYLTKTNQIYETTKLLRQVDMDMDKVQSKAAKEKLKNYGDMVESLKEQNELSNFELDIAKAKYEVLKAEIALEEAQNAKSVVRLSRDSEGNYGYVYSADPDKVNQAEQDLADKNNDLYNLLLNGENDYGQKLVKLREDYLAKFTELQTRAREDDEYATTQYQQDLDQLNREFEQLQLAYYSNYCLARTEINDVAAIDYTEGWVSAYDSIIDNTEYWEKANEEYAGTAAKNLEELKKKVNETVAPVFGSDLSGMAAAVGAVTTESEKLKKMINDEVLPALSKELTAVNNQTKAYADQRLEIVNLMAEMKKYIKMVDDYNEKAAEEAQKQKEADEEAERQRQAEKEAKEKSASEGKDTSTQSTTQQVETPAETKSAKTITGEIINDIYRGKAGRGVENRKNYFVSQGYTADDYYTAQKAIDKAYGIYGYPAYWQYLKKEYGFKTGGYTGDWDGDQGKLALLHQKELVLNADDTQNMLQAVDIIRQIVSMIDLNAVSAAAGLGYINSPSMGTLDQNLEQSVHIEASFPSVTDHNEIEEALNSLVNRAAQFANRN